MWYIWKIGVVEKSHQFLSLIILNSELGNKKTPKDTKSSRAFLKDGEGGIRTHGPFRDHRFSRPAP